MTKNKMTLSETIESVYKVKLIKNVANVENKFNIFHHANCNEPHKLFRKTVGNTCASQILTNDII